MKNRKSPEPVVQRVQKGIFLMRPEAYPLIYGSEERQAIEQLVDILFAESGGDRRDAGYFDLHGADTVGDPFGDE